MSFFGAVFGSLTMYWQGDVTGLFLALPFIAFALIALAAVSVIRAPGDGLTPTKDQDRVIVWSTVGEGVGLFLAANVVINLHRPDLLLPAMTLVVGLHFLPIAVVTSFRPYYALAATLLTAAAVGFLVRDQIGGVIAGTSAACALWIASIIAVGRDRRAKNATHPHPGTQPNPL